MSRMLNTEEASEKLRLTSRAVRQWAQKGVFKKAVKFGSYWRIPESEVNEILKNGMTYPQLKDLFGKEENAEK